MSDDPFDSPEWRKYARSAREELVPKLEESAVTVSLYNGTLDPKLAIETGYMVLMDKPIIAVVTPGAKVPRKLALVADEIVELSIDDPSFQARLAAAVQRVMEKVE